MRKLQILLISYGNLNYDGRLRELKKVAQLLGEVTIVSQEHIISARNKVCFKEKLTYFNFIKTSVNIAKQLEQIDILILDNRKSILPGLIVQRCVDVRFKVFDMRELYICKNVRSIKGKIGCLLENVILKRVDFVVCANSNRAKLTKKIFDLEKEPYVYENFRQLTYEAGEDLRVLHKKYEKILSEDKFRFVSTAGCLMTRGTMELLKAVINLPYESELFLIGAAPQKDIETVQNFVEKYKCDNIRIIGKVPEAELKYLINHCDVGVVYYHQNDLNNKYCASGKVFEFLYEGVPIVSTDNPPLKKFVRSII